MPLTAPLRPPSLSHSLSLSLSPLSRAYYRLGETESENLRPLGSSARVLRVAARQESVLGAQINYAALAVPPLLNSVLSAEKSEQHRLVETGPSACARPSSSRPRPPARARHPPSPCSRQAFFVFALARRQLLSVEGFFSSEEVLCRPDVKGPRLFALTRPANDL
jgi:hypothetical protein